MKTQLVTFERTQRGWKCTITFAFATTKQFTDEAMTVESHNAYRWWFSAWWSARQSMWMHIEIYGAKRGERKKLGWGD